LQAKEILARALEMDNNPVTLYFLAQTCHNLDEDSLSIKYFKQAELIMIPTFMPELYIHMSDSYLALGDYENAIKSLNNAYFYKPDNTSLLLTIGDLYETKLKNKAGAINCYETFIEQNPDDKETAMKLKSRINTLRKLN
jgi:tetratricopeptide (TPR) repeat protein